MPFLFRTFSSAARLIFSISCFALVTTASVAPAKITAEPSANVRPTGESYEAKGIPNGFRWNFADHRLPLLDLPDHLQPGIDWSLTYPMDQFGFPIFQSLYYNDRQGKYILLLMPRTGTRIEFVELRLSGEPGNYLSDDGLDIQLLDHNNIKTIRTSDATQYTFARFVDGELRCTRIKDRESSIYLSYTKDALIQSIVDLSGRTIRFNYARNHVGSITQTWTVNAESLSRTWAVSDNDILPAVTRISYASANALGLTKHLPNNAVVRQYTPEMAASDKMLAQIFGGPGAVAAANGFEPPALAAAYPLYRGDLLGEDGNVLRGHLSYAMHLYGSSDGSGDSPLYAPAGFTSHSDEPSPTDAVVTFYYPRLGNLTDVTLAVFHVSDFGISYEGERVRIGNIGGPGGSATSYKHSHIEFYKGNTGLPTAAARLHLRIDPSAVFRTMSHDAQ